MSDTLRFSDVLDENSKLMLRTLQPGMSFAMKGVDRGVFTVVEVVNPVESEPWVRAREMEGPRGSRRPRMNRAIRITNVERILTNE